MIKPSRDGIILTALLILIAACAIALLAQAKPASQPRALPSYCANGAVPSACIFGLQHSPYVIQSAYSYEANLLDGDIPVGDYDYMLPYGSEYAKLPGGSWNVYRAAGNVYVPGSGWVAKFIAPNGGHFAMLHLQYVNGIGAVRTTAPSPAGQLVFPEGRSGDDNTAAAASRVVGVSVGTGFIYHGGQTVGLTGWPTWSIYSNGGPGGPADAHLCVLLSHRSLAWFWKVATGQDKRPPHFPLRAWQGRTKKVSPYDGHSRRLLKAASYWWHHAPWLKGVLTKHFKQKPRGAGYYKWSFVKGFMYTWPHRPTWHPRVVRR